MTPRIALVLAGLLTVALPLPELSILGVGLAAAGLVTLWYSAHSPGSGGPTVLIGIAGVSWLSTPPGSSHGVRLAALALAVAVVHSSAALAAVVPSRARVPAGLLLRWVGWTALAAAVGGGLLAVVSLLPSADGRAPVLGATAAAVLAVGLVTVGVLHVGLRDPVRDDGRAADPG